jgi:small subunit ribosomal protein S1
MPTKKNTGLQFDVPVIKEGVKVKGIVLKKIENGVLVDCIDGVFTGVILSKEVKELERSKFTMLPGTKVEVEIINPAMRHEDGYYVVSITKLLQEATWETLLGQSNTDEVITVIPTEANLGWLLVDMHGIKWFIPLSQLAPIHYPRVEDGDQEAIFEKLLELIGQELRVRVINVDEEEKRIILSEREALKEERDKVMAELAVGKVFDGVVSGLSSYGLFVTIGGTVEGLVHISELTYGHVNDVNRLGKVGDKMKVKVIGLENGKISLSAKQIKEDPWAAIPRKLKQGDLIEGEVIRFVPYGVFVRVFDDINGLIHLSELSQKAIHNPNEIVKLGQMVKAKVILLDVRKRKIGLSVKALQMSDGGDQAEIVNKPSPKKAPAKKAAAEEETA